MMEYCRNLMMSLGWLGMVLGVLLLAALIVLVIVLAVRVSRWQR